MVVSMHRWEDKVAVVTGAGSGIGAATAKQLINSGLKMACLDFSQENLENFSKHNESHAGKFKTFVTDVTKEEEILNSFKWIKENFGPIHILVNCAGIIRSVGLTNGNTQFWKDILNTNVLGLCITTGEAIKDMKANNVDGHIVHINSVCGHGRYNPDYVSRLNVYPASKHAVTALTETLRQELNSIGSKIKVTSVSPGLVKTGIFHASMTASEISSEKIKEVQQRLEACTHLIPEDVADAIVFALSTPPHVQIHELTIKPLGEIE